MAKWAPGHRADVSRCGRVRSTLDLLDRTHRTDLELVYAPFGWGRLDGATEKQKDRTNWDVYCRFAVQTRQLLPLALVTPELATAFLRVHPERGRAAHDADEDAVHPFAGPSFGELLGFVRDEVEKLKNQDIRPGKAFPSGHKLVPALHAAERRELAAIAAYDELRKDRIRSDRRPNVALLEKCRADKERRDWDVFASRTGVRLGGAA